MPLQTKLEDLFQKYMYAAKADELVQMGSTKLHKETKISTTWYLARRPSGCKCNTWID
jgi:hypothetical protein